MKLEIGKEYMSRGGLKVKIYDIAKEGDYPVIAGVVHNNEITARAYTITGRYYKITINELDIISEWQEPLNFDWLCLPAWCDKYIAMDINGVWYAYSDKPTHNREDWYCRDMFQQIPKKHTPKNFTGTWENSLYKNPNLS